MKSIGRSFVGSIVLALLAVACGGASERNPTDTAEGGTPSVAGSAAGGGTRPHAGSSSRGGNGAGGTSGASRGGALPVPSGGAEAIPEGGEGGTTVVVEGGAPGGGTEADGGAGGEPPVGIDCSPIVFGDPELERVVRELAAKPTGPLTAADVAGVTDLTAPTLFSLKGAECLTNLVSLDAGALPPGNITDLRPLAGLSKLDTLSLARNPLSSVAPLGKLPNLKWLYLFHVPGALDLDGLSGASKLEFLDLEGVTISDLTPLGTVPTLTDLNIRSGNVLAPGSIGVVKSLESLDATDVFSDAAPVGNLTKLRKLRIGHQPLANFSALGSLVNMRFLDIVGVGVADISAIAKMQSLVNLTAANNSIVDVSPISNLAFLNILVLVNNKVTNLAPIAANAALGQGDLLYLTQNPLDCAAQAQSIQAMRLRGIEVNTDCPIP